MLKELNNIEAIDKFFDEELPKKANWRFHRAQIYSMALEFQKERERKREIGKLVEKDWRMVRDCILIGEDMAIVEAEVRGPDGQREIAYYPVVRGLPANERCESLDEAIVYMLCKKYGYERSAPHLIYNMLRMDREQK